MVFQTPERTEADVRELRATLANLNYTVLGSNGQGGLTQSFDVLNQSVTSLLTTRAETPPAPVGNLLFNGEVGHSWNSFEDAAYVTTDKAKEAAYFWSHNIPVGPRTFVDADVSVGSDRITIVAHGLTVGAPVDLITTGTLPAGLALLTTYFVIVINDDTIALASTIANAYSTTPVDITAAAGGGTHTVQQQLIFTHSATSSVNNTLKTNGYGAITAHSTYDPKYSRWNGTNGWAELTGTQSIDALLPSNFIDATTPLARVSLRAARKNQYIEIPNACVMGAGIWDNTSGQRDFLTGSLGFAAQVNGSPASTVERRYKIHVTTDRGFTLLSPEITIANAPADGFFTSTANVSMSWSPTSGQLQVDIYEYIPSLAEYRLLEQVSNAFSYIHLGAYLRTVSGYPAATGTVRQAIFKTEVGDMSDLSIDGTIWDTVNFPIAVPNNYNKANTTDREWLRLWLTVAPNLYVTGCTTDGSTTLTAPAVVFASEYDALFDSGTFVAQIYDVNDTLLATTTVTSRTDDTHVVLGTTIATGSNRKIRIVGGGFHGVVIDKIHLGYQQNTDYVPNALDIRTLQPVAAPSSSSQGAGTGGSGGGINNCVARGTKIKRYDKRWTEIQTEQPGALWASGEFRPNILTKLKIGFENVRRVRAANGVELVCTDTERFFVSATDINGTPLYRLRVGGYIQTEIDGAIEESRIVEISDYLGQTQVYTPTLSNSHLFIAGEIPEASFWQRFFDKILRRKERKGGFVLHNRKALDDNPT